MNSSQGSSFSWCWQVARLPYSSRAEALCNLVCNQVHGNHCFLTKQWWTITGTMLSYWKEKGCIFTVLDGWKWSIRNYWKFGVVGWWAGTQSKLLLLAEVSESISWCFVTGWWDGSVDMQKSGAGREKRKELTLVSAFIPLSIFLELI